MTAIARTVTDKTSHIGRAGQLAAMAEILARGWNVAVPEVDVGDDIFVAQDDGTRLTRVQVKTTAGTVFEAGWKSHPITLPYAQFSRDEEEVPFTYVFAVRTGDRWRFVVIERGQLREKWIEFARERREAGHLRKNPASDPKAIGIQFTITATEATAWSGRSFKSYLDTWDDFELLMQPTQTVTTTSPDPSLSPEPRSRPDAVDARGSSPSGE